MGTITLCKLDVRRGDILARAIKLGISLFKHLGNLAFQWNGRSFSEDDLLKKPRKQARMA